MSLTLRWRRLPPTIVLRWAVPVDAIAPLPSPNWPQPIAMRIGPPGRDADQIGNIDGGTFN
ncbi:hypothetical protein [Allosphingosinicella indica]|uniref:Uncharacterized protein n=1 Tax=Allosphingosinicella indica TaxID=941907 RepID=A0A1X7GIZ9_9SPHN|nr:hypothetical protein [Allosphingosinicella indica]SMF70483.1 hypothetical protein SAMN06295910_1878 [Allosphingosinicella indica]